MSAKELTCTSYISIDGAEPVLFDSLSDEEKERCLQKMMDRLSRNMSEYYSNHMDEFIKEG